jgi:hypothetical protein
MNISESRKESIFMWSFILLYGLYIVTFLGIVSFNSHYIRMLRSFIEVITCLLLMLRFNPYVYHRMTSFDKTMIFSVATFLLFNIAISELYLYDK